MNPVAVPPLPFLLLFTSSFSSCKSPEECLGVASSSCLTESYRKEWRREGRGQEGKKGEAEGKEVMARRVESGGSESSDQCSPRRASRPAVTSHRPLTHPLSLILELLQSRTVNTPLSCCSCCMWTTLMSFNPVSLPAVC